MNGEAVADFSAQGCGDRVADGLVALPELLADVHGHRTVGDEPRDERLEQVGGERAGGHERAERLAEARLAVARDLALRDDARDDVVDILGAERVGGLEEPRERLVQLRLVEPLRRAQAGLDLGELLRRDRGLGEQEEGRDVGAGLAVRAHLVGQVDHQGEEELVVGHVGEHLAEEGDVDPALRAELVGRLVRVDRAADDLRDVTARPEALGGDLPVHAGAVLRLLEVGDLGDLAVLEEGVERPLVSVPDHLRQRVVVDELLPLGPGDDLVLAAVRELEGEAVALVDVVHEHVHRRERSVDVGDAGELGPQALRHGGVELPALDGLEGAENEDQVALEEPPLAVVRPALRNEEGGLDLRLKIGRNGREEDMRDARSLVHGWPLLLPDTLPDVHPLHVRET